MPMTRKPKPHTAIAAGIRAVRTVKGLSQKELAGRAGTFAASIAAFESGKRLPSIAMLQRIAKATGYKLVITFTRYDA